MVGRLLRSMCLLSYDVQSPPAQSPSSAGETRTTCGAPPLHRLTTLRVPVPPETDVGKGVKGEKLIKGGTRSYSA